MAIGREKLVFHDCMNCDGRSGRDIGLQLFADGLGKDWLVRQTGQGELRNTPVLMLAPTISNVVSTQVRRVGVTIPIPLLIDRGACLGCKELDEFWGFDAM